MQNFMIALLGYEQDFIASGCANAGQHADASAGSARDVSVAAVARWAAPLTPL